jgi:sugar-specific transcriptional regulator TrmB
MNEDSALLVKSIGFKEKEARIYLALLELGKAGVSEIAKQSRIKRPTAYLILEDLVGVGYVNQIPWKNIKQYQAVDPSIILIKKRNDLKSFSEMVPFFQNLHKEKDVKPKIHYIDNKEGIWNVYESLNFSKETTCVSSYKKINDHFPGKVNDWIKGYKQKRYKVSARHLIPDNPDDIQYGKKLKQAGQKVRIFPKKFDTDIVITENKIAISSLEEKPFLVLIESEKLAQSLKPVFEIIWEVGKNLK